MYSFRFLLLLLGCNLAACRGLSARDNAITNTTTVGTLAQPDYCALHLDGLDDTEIPNIASDDKPQGSIHMCPPSHGPMLSRPPPEQAKTCGLSPFCQQWFWDHRMDTICPWNPELWVAGECCRMLLARFVWWSKEDSANAPYHTAGYTLHDAHAATNSGRSGCYPNCDCNCHRHLL
jgi:hypothetical protein